MYEVVEVDPGVRLGLRNVRSGDHHDVLEHQGSLEAKIGQYLLMRIETLDGATTAHGASMLVPAAQLDRMLAMMDAPDIDELLDWYVDATAPPALVTRDGEPLVMANASISTTASLEEVLRLLDDEFGSSGQPDQTIAERCWAVTVDRGGGESSLAQISIGPDQLIEVSTMSHERHERHVAQLLEILPGAQVVDEEFESGWDAVERHRLG